MSKQIKKRDLEILKLVCKGLTGQRIAVKLNIASQTVDNAKGRIMQQLGASNMPEAVYKAFKNGIID